jgi:transposase
LQTSFSCGAADGVASCTSRTVRMDSTPPSLRERVPEDHLAWFVLEAFEEMDLTGFYGNYRSDGHRRAAYEPAMMVALVLYSHATEQRFARAMECHCRQDIAYGVIAANRVPDHATIARFLVRHEVAA